MDVIGNSLIIVLICYVIVGTKLKKSVSSKDMFATVLILCVLHLILLR